MHLYCNNLTFSYPENQEPILEQLSFNFSHPGFHAIFGPSGLGKSTLARLISKNDPAISYQDIKTTLYCYNLERLPGWNSVGKVLNQTTAKKQRALLQTFISLFQVEDLLELRFQQLSMGQQNRINLIRYLLQDFSLLILDETLANVDEKLRATIITGIKKHLPQKMFLYISHNLLEVATYCDQILLFTPPDKNPPYPMLQGLNLQENEKAESNKRDRCMLSIMNCL